jgi:acyl carrier protein
VNFKEYIENFIIEELLLGNGRNYINPDESLISSGIIDSLALMRLITFVEEQFDVVVEDDEVLPQNFETINIISEFLSNKKAS